MMFVICRLQELAWKNQISLYACFIHLTIAYESVDRPLLWSIFAHFGVLQNIISVIRQFHDGMRACVQLDDRVYSEWLAVKQGLRRGCVFAPLLFNIFFAALINVAYARFQMDEDIVDALMRLRKNMGPVKDNQRRASPGDVSPQL